MNERRRPLVEAALRARRLAHRRGEHDRPLPRHRRQPRGGARDAGERSSPRARTGCSSPSTCHDARHDLGPRAAGRDVMNYSGCLRPDLGLVAQGPPRGRVLRHRSRRAARRPGRSRDDAVPLRRPLACRPPLLDAALEPRCAAAPRRSSLPATTAGGDRNADDDARRPDALRRRRDRAGRRVGGGRAADDALGSARHLGRDACWPSTGRLIALRRSSPALARGGIRFASVGADALAYLRETPEERLLCLAARADHEPVRLALAELGASGAETLYGADAEVRGRRAHPAGRRPGLSRVENGGLDGGSHLQRRRQGLPGRRPGGQRSLARHPGRGVPRPRRPLGLRQDDGATHGRRARGDLRRDDLDRRPRGQRADAEGARHRHGLPELRPLPAHERGREHRLRPAAAQGAEGGDRAPGRVGGQDARPRAVPRAPAEGAFRRAAPAGRDGSRDRPRAAGLPDGRAALEPGREAPRADARRHRAPAGRARDDDDLRHARPGRGDDDGRPRRRDEPRRAAAGGRPAAAVRLSPPISSWRASSARRL